MTENKNRPGSATGAERDITLDVNGVDSRLEVNRRQQEFDSLEFLEKLRPGGPWVLTAIEPDGPPETITAATAEDIAAFVRANDGRRNIYYSVNPTRTPLTKKAKKTDIAAIEFALADLDPADGEASGDAKQRYMAQLDAWFEPKPTAIVDSGNGIQCLWRLQEPIELGAPRKNENGKLVFCPEDQEKIEGVEARIKAVMERLGGKAGTQNIDRILRLPGTTNLPGERKKKAGRVPCRTQLIHFNGVAHSLSAFPLPTDGGSQAGTDRGQRAGSMELPPALLSLLYLTEPGAYASRSELLFAFITGALRKGVDDHQIAAACAGEGQGGRFTGCAIYEHCRENGGREYILRQIANAYAKMPADGPLAGLTSEQAAEVRRLSELSLAEYDMQRKAAASGLGVRVGTLDEIVGKLRPTRRDDDTTGSITIDLDPPLPWPDAVEGAALIADIAAAIRKHVILSEQQALAVALWIIHTHAVELAEHAPRLQVKSPTPRCGKSTLMAVIKAMVPKPLNTESITMAALFRAIAAWHPTVLIDEADSFLKREDGGDNEELRGILNAGHGRGGAVIRTVGDEHEPRAFPVFGPIAFAWLVRRGRQVAETLADRSITIELRRRLPDEKITRLRSNRTEHLALLGRKAARWVGDHKGVLADADPALPDHLGDRAQDNWRPLIAIADAISPDLGERARKAAVKIEAERVHDDEEAAVQALGDVADIFKKNNKEFLTSAELVTALVALEDRKWGEWRRGQPVTPTGLSYLLKPFSIRPRWHSQTSTTKPARGYDARPILEAAKRFVDPSREEPKEVPF